MECLICNKDLKYLEESLEKECSFCGKKSITRNLCPEGHFVCDECHSKGVELIKDICQKATSRNPYKIAQDLMDKDFIRLHGPEHHVLVASALLCAYKNSGGDIDLKKALSEIEVRGKQVPGGVCSTWGSCGAAISTGIFLSIISKSVANSQTGWGLSNLMTAKALNKLGTIGGPGCCKRTSFLSIEAAIDFVSEHFSINMEKETNIKCKFSSKNKNCIKERCPYFEE